MIHPIHVKMGDHACLCAHPEITTEEYNNSPTLLQLIKDLHT